MTAGWTFTWAGAAPLSFDAIITACSNLHAILELELHEGGRLASKAAFSAIPGNPQATLDVACSRASLLAKKANAPVSFDLPYRSPATRQKLALKKARLFARLFSILLHESWMIGIVKKPIESSIQWKSLPHVEWISPREKHRYLADPFSLPDDPSVIYCEEFDYETQLGKLISLEIENGKITQELEMRQPLPGHLSYPYLFKQDGKTYALPESCSARTLQLFLLQDGEWVPYSTILKDTAAADSILFEHGGYFWIAYTDVDLGSVDNLNLLYAPSLHGPWQPHPQNPVSLDPRSSRCGGTPFKVINTRYRPAQDCSKIYGGSIRIMEILECTPERYEEVETTHIPPPAGLNPHGFHTLSMCGDYSLIDAKRMQCSPKHIWRKIKRRLLKQ